MAVAALVLASRLKGFLESEAFRKMVEHHTGNAFSGVTELDPLRWNGSAVRSGTLRLTGGSNSKLESIQATTLQARVDWSAALRGTWCVKEITAENLRGKFGSGGADLPLATQPSLPAWLLAFLPSRVEIGKARIARADLDFGSTEITGTSLEILPDGSGWRFQGRGGKLIQSPLPILSIDSFVARTVNESVEIDSSVLRLGAEGKISAKGRWPGAMEIEWQNISATDLLDSKWKNKVDGKFGGEARVEEGKTSGRVNLRNGTLRGFQVLEDIANFSGRREFRHLPIQKASADFQILGENYKFSNISLESTELLRVEGHLSISPNHELSGELQVGVNPSVLAGFPGARSKVFTFERDGFVWAPVHIGGTLDSPTENLSGRLVSAVGESAIEAVAPLLETVPKPARKAVGDSINTLFDILGR